MPCEPRCSKKAMEVADEGKQLMHSRPPLVPQSYPWLVIFDGEHKQRQTFFSISENHYYARIIPEMRNKYVWSSPYGWWVLDDLNTNDCLLLNPVSMEKIQLPPLENGRYGTCILSAPPSDPNCHVLFVNPYEDVALFCRPSDGKFLRQRLEDPYKLSRVATIKGKTYGLIRTDYALVTIDFVGPMLQFRQVINGGLHPHVAETNRFQVYLIESCGELLLIYKTFYTLVPLEVVGFKIFRVDAEMAWVELKSIGERAIFLSGSNHTGISCSATRGIRENCIYFTEPYDRNLYIYELEDRSITISRPCSIVSRLDSLTNWVMMSTTN